MSQAPNQSFSNAFRAVGITFETILGEDPAMREALKRAEAAAQGDVTVLILGESGTGKNLVAQAIHNASKRASGPYVGLNCSAVPEALIESELFGHEKGSFTNAEKQRIGAFERADNGTLFLDEIGDMSLTAQTKVLNAIEYKQFARVGGDQLLTSNVRFVAATNQPLRELIGTKEFREDLFYRLAEVTVQIPPLRHRKGDIPLYAEAFLEEAADKYDRPVRHVSRAALSLLAEHDWPGNVRELRACIRAGVMFAKGKMLEPKDLSLEVRKLPDTVATNGRGGGTSVGEMGALDLASVEKTHIARVLSMCDWKKREAAKLLGVSRPTLDRKIDQYGLTRDE